MENKEQKKTELSFTEKLMVDSFKSAEKVLKELDSLKLTKSELKDIAVTFYISAMNSIRDSKKAKSYSQTTGDSATDAQVAFLQKLGYDGDINLTKTEASKLIEEMKKNKETIY